MISKEKDPVEFLIGKKATMLPDSMIEGVSYKIVNHVPLQEKNQKQAEEMKAWVDEMNDKFHQSNKKTTEPIKDLKLFNPEQDMEIVKLFVPIWEEGVRQEASMALAGLLKRNGYSRERTLKIVELICKNAKDPEMNQRLPAVEATYAKDEKAHLTGLPTIAKYFGNELTEQLAKILNIKINSNNLKETKEFPRILLPKTGKLISEFVEEITPHLINSQQIYYRPEEDSIILINQNTNTTQFKSLTPSELVTFIEQHLEPVTLVKVDKEWIPQSKSITTELGKIILSSGELKSNLPKIREIFSVPMPILKNGQLIFPKKGYDSELESYMPENSPELDLTISLEDAKENINMIFEEFVFKAPQDKTNAIAGLTTPYLRGLYSRPTIRTPLFNYSANRERAGKDFCAAITGIVYYGESIDETPICDEKGAHDEEFRKKLLSNFKLGKKRFHSSNNKGYLNSAELEAVTTNENFTDRVLGSNTIATYKNNMEFSISANSGITYTPDLANRMISVNLFLPIEDPNKRVFKRPDLHKYVHENRSKIISSIYALVKNWHEKGMPSGTIPFTSFPEWAKICGGIMETSGLGNPCIKNDEVFSYGGDSETKDMKKLFELCYDKFKVQNKQETEWILKKDIMNLFESQESSNESFTELFSWIDWSKKGGRNKFGLLFEKFVGRILSDIQLFRIDNSKNERRTYQFRKVGVHGVDGVDASRYILNENDNELYIESIELPHLPQLPQKSDNILLSCSVCDAPPPCNYTNSKGRPLCEICADPDPTSNVEIQKLEVKTTGGD